MITKYSPESAEITFDEYKAHRIHTAMLRAAQLARDEARAAGLKVVLWENGEVVYKDPNLLDSVSPIVVPSNDRDHA
jgi:hypothetical protein